MSLVQAAATAASLLAGEHIWLTSVLPPQVIKYSMDGEQLLTLGLRGKPGHDTKHFCKPTAVRLCHRLCSQCTALSIAQLRRFVTSFMS